jgi:hypothetical protein
MNDNVVKKLVVREELGFLHLEGIAILKQFHN